MTLNKSSKLFSVIDHYLKGSEELVIRERRYQTRLDQKAGLMKTVEIEREIIREDYETAIEDLERHILSLYEKPIIVDEIFYEEKNELILQILLNNEITYYLKGQRAHD